MAKRISNEMNQDESPICHCGTTIIVKWSKNSFQLAVCKLIQCQWDPPCSGRVWCNTEYKTNIKTPLTKSGWSKLTNFDGLLPSSAWNAAVLTVMRAHTCCLSLWRMTLFSVWIEKRQGFRFFCSPMQSW